MGKTRRILPCTYLSKVMPMPPTKRQCPIQYQIKVISQALASRKAELLWTYRNNVQRKKITATNGPTVKKPNMHARAGSMTFLSSWWLKLIKRSKIAVRRPPPRSTYPLARREAGPLRGSRSSSRSCDGGGISSLPAASDVCDRSPRGVRRL